MIAHWATIWVAEHAGTALQVSNGWIQSFMERNGLVLRRATSKSKLTQKAIVERGVKFIEHVQQLIKEYDIQYSNIYNMDETAVFLDHNRNTTLDVRGAKDVHVKSFGLEKNRFTAVFAASASGK
ncbi:Pogo transposable element [Phytophthora megakarya]|uniref:Pogo transposable element n=1 Tax=Phytophthora megakarya TaxID=4795 RepID=A0A225V3U5_9STRA|nr:Pogo transposable element [Phytophthora megakarya]